MIKWLKRLLANNSRRKNPNRRVSQRQKRSFFSAPPPSAALYLSLVEDCSGSMTNSDKMEKSKTASLDLVNSLKSLNVAVGLISFGEEIMRESDLTEDLIRIKESIRNLRAYGGTPFFEAIELSKREHLDRVSGEKVLVVDTDGQPTSSGEEEILELGQQIKDEGTRIITIGIGRRVNSSFLRRLASTPEDYHFAKAPKDIAPAFEEVTGSIVKKSQLTV